VPNQRMMSAAGFAEGSMASRASGDDADVGSASSAARSKNCRNADCSCVSYNAPTVTSVVRTRVFAFGPEVLRS
jgi:hypothetical protein